MKKSKFIAMLTSIIVLSNLTVALSMGIGLTKEDARKENRNLEKKVNKQVESIANKYKYKENEFEVKKCFAFGGDSTTKTDRTIIMEICSSKTFDEEDVLTIYTNILKEVRSFNKSNKVDINKVGVWFVDAATGETSYKWVIEGETISDLENITFWNEKRAREEVYRLLF